MTTDAQSREPDRPRPDLFRLPDVRDLEILRVRYRTPQVRSASPTEIREYSAGVELLVRTSEPFRIRALPPVLYVGDTLVGDWEQLEPTLYRFYAFDEEALREGASIRLGWPDEPEGAKDTGYRFAVGREEER